MIELVFGGSASGKSDFAETEILKFCSQKNYYIATMKVFGKEEEERICRHKKMRSGKGFITIEQSENLENALLKADKKTLKKSSALVECLSNLCANEMFTSGKKDFNLAEKRILKGIDILCSSFENVVFVSANVFSDGEKYTDETLAYMRILGKVNSYISQRAQKIVELVAGIPVFIRSR